MWTKALNQAGVDAYSALRKADNVFYPSALCVAGPSSSRAEVAPKVLKSSQVAPTSTLTALTDPSKEADRASIADKDKKSVKEKASEPTKLPPAPKDSSKEKGATQGQVLVLATLPFTTKEDIKDKGAAQATVPKSSAQTVVKANPPSSNTN